MALYTLKSRADAIRPLANYTGNNGWVLNHIASVNGTPSASSTQMFNALGRTAGAQATQGGNDNFFVKRGKSIENALGTTGSAIASAVKDVYENNSTEQMRRDNKRSMNDIAKKYGFNSWSDWQDANAAARESGDAEAIKRFDEQLKEFQAQANSNAAKANKKAADYKDYRENNYVSKKINQDRGKFAGSAINTLSTAADVALPGAGVAFNSVQGAAEGLADELEQNGFENFDWGRAGQNALIGGVTGGVVGSFNKGLSSAMAKRAAAKGLTNVATGGVKNAIKNGAKTIGTGAIRGALSGAVGGATGAGLSSALNGVDFGQGVQNALQGAVQGAQQGAITGGIMAGTNMALSKTPGIGNVMQQLNEAGENWKRSGSNFDERLTNTLTSGDSAVGDWLMNKRQSRVLGAAGSLGNRVQDVGALNQKKIDLENQIAQLEQDYADRKRTKGDMLSSKRPLEWELADVEAQLRFNAANQRADGGITEDITKRVLSTIAEIDPNATMEDPYAAGWDLLDRSGNLAELRQNMVKEWGAWMSPEDVDNVLGTTPTTAKGWASQYGDSEQIAKDLGYKSYGDAYQQFVKAHPEMVPSGKNVTEWILQRAQYDSNMGNEPPSTAKGWLKKAGQRIAEDLNNSNLGNRIQDTSSDMPEDIRNMQIRDYNAYADGVDDIQTPTAADTYTNPTLETKVFRTTGGDEVPLYIEKWQTPNEVWNDFVNSPEGASYRGQTLAGVTDLGQTTRAIQTPQVDAWDRVAQEAGYNNYDEVIQRYMEANPNTPLNQRGAAGQILTWLDQNPNTPTTAGGWLKQAGQRIVEDANSRGVGLSLKDVSEEPQTEMYDTLMGKKTNTATKLRNAAGLKLQEQYGTIDKPTAKATNAPETLQKIAKAGFTKPAEVERMADAITGSNGEASKLVANIVKTAKPVDTFSGETSGQTLDDYIDFRIQRQGLNGIREGKAVKSQIQAIMSALPSHAEGSIDFVDDPTDVFKMTQILDAEAANYEGRSGMNYGTTTPDKLRAAKVIKDVSNLMKNRIYETADVKAALTPEVAQNLKSYAPNNKAWSDYVDNEIMSANSVKDLRSVQAPWVRAKKIIDNGYMNSVTYGGRASGGSSALPLTKRGLIGAALNATVNSKPGLRAQAKALNTAADFVDNKTSAPVDTGTATPNVTQTGYNPATQLFNALGRTQAITSAQESRPANVIENQVQEIGAESGYMPPLGASTSASGGTTLESLAAPTTAGASLYNTLSGISNPTTGMTGYYQTTGDYWTDILASALSSAIDDNDVEAFKTLFPMYQDSMSKLQQATTATSNASELNATQQAQLAKLDAADSAIDELESLFEGAGGGQGLIVGNLKGIAGNIGLDSGAKTYNDMAEGLVNQISAAIGKTDSLNTEGEVKRALKLIPQLTDDAQTARNKLEELRRMLATTKASYNSAYGLTY